MVEKFIEEFEDNHATGKSPAKLLGTELSQTTTNSKITRNCLLYP